MVKLQNQYTLSINGVPHTTNDKYEAYVYNYIFVACTAPSRNYLECDFTENSN